MAEVRRAVPGDVPDLVEMGRALHAESPTYSPKGFDPAKVRALAERLTGPCSPEDTAVFVAVAGRQIVGMFVGVVADSWFGHERKASDLTVYVKPEHRGGTAFVRLLHAFEAWADERGAVECDIGVSTGIHVDRTVHAYQRSGYTLSPTRIVNKRLRHGD